METIKMQCYEIPNTFTRDMPLDEQIGHRINDWRCDGPEGRASFGHTEAEARRNMEDMFRRI